jgi:hypothetical protein
MYCNQSWLKKKNDLSKQLLRLCSVSFSNLNIGDLEKLQISYLLPHETDNSNACRNLGPRSSDHTRKANMRHVRRRQWEWVRRVTVPCEAEDTVERRSYDTIGQLCSASYVVRSASAKFGRHAGKMKFGTQDEEWTSIAIIRRAILRACLSICNMQ